MRNEGPGDDANGATQIEKKKPQLNLPFGATIYASILSHEKELTCLTRNFLSFKAFARQLEYCYVVYFSPVCILNQV